MKSNTNLKTIMNRLNVKLIDVENLLFVDSSTVSKWRNGSRQLRKNGDYAMALAEYFMQQCESSDYEPVRNLLQAEYDGANRLSPNELTVALSEWLTSYNEETINDEKYQKAQTFDTQIKVYCYDKGREKASFHILKALSEMEGGQNFLIFDREESSWGGDRKEFLNKRKSEYGNLSEKHSITVIHTLNLNQTDIMNLMANDLEMNLRGNVNTYYLPINRTADFFSDMLIIKDKAALICQYNPDYMENRYAEYHTDIRSVKHYQNMYQILLNRAIPIYKKYFSYNRNKLMDILYKQFSMCLNEYIVSTMPAFITMPYEVINKYAGMYEMSHHAQKSIDIFNNLKSQWLISLRKSKCRHIYNLDEMMNFRENDPRNNDFCSFFEFPVNITKQDYCAHIEELIYLLENNENFELALVNDMPVLNKKEASIILKENTDSVIYATNKLTGHFIALETNDPTFEYNLYQYYENYWEEIPPLQKDKNWVIAKLKSIIAMYGI